PLGAQGTVPAEGTSMQKTFVCMPPARGGRGNPPVSANLGNNILDSVVRRGYTLSMDAKTTLEAPAARVPRTLLEAVQYFADPDTSLAFMVALRWPNGVACPTCGRTDVRFISTRRLWECKAKHPRKQFSIKVGTIFEDSPLGMDKWLPVVWLVANCKNGISSYEVARDLGVTQ